MILIIYIAIFAIVFFMRYRALSGGSLTLQVDDKGRSYYETRQPVSKKSANFNIRVGLPVDTRLFFKVAPETAMSRFLKSIGVAEEFETGDAKTDALLFVSDDPALFQDLMQAQNVRTAIDTLMAQARKARLRAFGHRLWLEVDNVPAGWIESNRQKILTHLWEISDIATKRAQTTLDTAPFFSYAQRAAFFMVLHATLLTAGIIGALAYAGGDVNMLDISKFMMASLALVPLTAGLWVFALLASLKRSMWMVVALGDFILIGLAGLVLSVPLLTQEANRRLPQAPPSVQSQPLLQKSCEVHCKKRRRKRSTSRSYPLGEAGCMPGAREREVAALRDTDSICASSAKLRYKLSFPSWKQDGGEMFTMDAGPQLFDAGQRGDYYDFAVHPGALGHAWLDEDEVRRSANGGE
ncbi:MAG TPA: hypothetical protein PLW48_02205 [Alphaproteobacteria bacterium]|nr:hypothetical protein [Alphaproteobacteria bacterium]